KPIYPAIPRSGLWCTNAWSLPRYSVRATMAERPESSDHPIILIVEDSDSQRYLWGRRFAGEHCRILEASTGSEALQLATDSDPDIVILDVQLPDRSGMEICRTLKGTPATSAIPVMLVS